MFNGDVFVAGRRKDMIIVAGKNIYPQDLEAIVNEVPGVHPGRAAAFGLYDEELGTEIVVIVAEAETADADEQERLAEEIQNRVTMNSAVAIRHVQVVGLKWLLKTSSGKIERTANKEKFVKEFVEDREVILF